jgi:hypothetical protein
MGDLLKEARELSSAKAKKPKMEAILERLSPADRKDLEAALADPTISVRAICRVLKARGFDITENPVRTWRTGK